jgi:hypothetical protein
MVAAAMHKLCRTAVFAHMDTSSFEWRPDRPRRVSRTLLSLTVATAIIAPGLIYARTLMVQRSSSSIVHYEASPREIAGPDIARSNSPPSPQLRMGDSLVPPGDSHLHDPSGVLLINKHVVGNDGTPAGDGQQERTVEREKPSSDQVRSFQSPEQRRKASQNRAVRGADQRVFVVVRRVGPPHDTKVLRGRIHDGHLIVDSRDRRDITIR